MSKNVTNFDVIAESPATLARFMSEFDRELTMKDSVCRFCGYYEELDKPTCHAKCSDGFKRWLEKRANND